MENRQYYYAYQTIIGKIHIVEQDNFITGIKYQPPETKPQEKETLLIKETYLQLVDYLTGKRQLFDIPIKTAGTAFQEKIWTTLQTIPYGEVWSYKRLAETAGSPRGYRAAGMGNNKNPIAIVIPCHRVIGSDGTLVGYAGGLHIKQQLLAIEQQYTKQE
ncbi:MAG: methylated-DNA--[protein]-cysteine S-methyltransferase [Bacteroidales bacterium]|jgi:methylated-DNA-[protein]-cysteine S-methyltransferase|nr:methylated-DNA--[protein]-cysteine S-methyltransferase [Bacteroidales bacterium]